MKKCLSCNEYFVSDDWNCPSCHWKPVFKNGFPLFAPEYAAVGSGFDDEFFPYLFDIESSNFWFIARNKLILDLIRKYFPKFENYLEVGCGTGFVLNSVAATFPKAYISGSDLSYMGLSYAARRIQRGSLIQMDAGNIPFHEEFDLIGSFDVLEHLDDDMSALNGFFRASAPGGGLIITVPQNAWLWSDSDDVSCHVRRYARQEILNKLQQAGYDILCVTSFVFFLLPLMMLSRLKKGRSKEEVLSDLKLNPVINQFLSIVMSVERTFIKYGVTFPTGGSLIVAARKKS